LETLVNALGEHAGLVDGFVLPKFDPATGPGFLDAVESVSEHTGRAFWVMPVLESSAVLDLESRQATLVAIRDLVAERQVPVLSYRIGATDLSALLGIRRPPELAAYDIAAVASVIADIVNVFCRAGRGASLVSGPVWEYYGGSERVLKPQLRESPFRHHEVPTARSSLVSRGLDGLLREVFLDQANGLTGKSIIHPSHIPAVHALSVVTHEEYVDAHDIVHASTTGGASASSYSNKMNEGHPHRAWAHSVMRRADAFGVARREISFADLLDVSVVR
jgi:citrate lyase beta subunit